MPVIRFATARRDLKQNKQHTLDGHWHCSGMLMCLDVSVGPKLLTQHDPKHGVMRPGGAGGATEESRAWSQQGCSRGLGGPTQGGI